jgi:RNA polymerase sigma-70 factor (ECF subfamily)
MSVRDEGWFEEVFSLNQPSVVRYVASRVRDADAVKDIVASTFEAAWQQRSTIEPPELPYLLAIARNHVRRHWRLQEKATIDISEFLEDSELVSRDDEDRYVHKALSTKLLGQVFKEISALDAEILVLAAWDGLDSPAIAEVLGLTEVNARVRLHRAKKRAEKCLHQLDADFVEEQIDATRARPNRGRK